MQTAQQKQLREEILEAITGVLLSKTINIPVDWIYQAMEQYGESLLSQQSTVSQSDAEAALKTYPVSPSSFIFNKGADDEIVQQFDENDDFRAGFVAGCAHVRQQLSQQQQQRENDAYVSGLNDAYKKITCDHQYREQKLKRIDKDKDTNHK